MRGALEELDANLTRNPKVRLRESGKNRIVVTPLDPQPEPSQLRRVINATFATRLDHIWGEGTTACASDSKKFGAWDQNLMTEWHIRYRGRGVMIYWHIKRRAACIYSQLKRCSSSEVRLEDQEVSVLALHLLQASLVYVNTLMFQQVLEEPDWLERMPPEDLRALSPLIYHHINPYGTFDLDMAKRLLIDLGEALLHS